MWWWCQHDVVRSACCHFTFVLLSHSPAASSALLTDCSHAGAASVLQGAGGVLAMEPHFIRRKGASVNYQGAHPREQ